MISSINHHFSIVHVRVHPAYLDWLASGTLPALPDSSTDTEQPWHTLVLRRTRWYDLLNADDRLEGLDALWAVFSWLMR
jgi:hypothetical protein